MPSRFHRVVVLLISLAGGATQSSGAPQRVSLSDLQAAMAAERGYDLRKTTNLGRLQAGVILRLAERARTRRPDGPPLLLDHADWFEAYLRTVGLTAEEAPISVRLSAENRQDAWVEYREGCVVRNVIKGPPLHMALNVRVGPTPQATVPPSYSYEDLESVPRLRVTVQSEYRYRLLDFGDRVVLDDIEGLRGRPTTGVLGALFRLIGEADAVYSRMAFAGDGIQVAVGKARKALFSRTLTITIQPDGTTLRGIPDRRSDLAHLEARLREPLELEYQPWSEACRPEPR